MKHNWTYKKLGEVANIHDTLRKPVTKKDRRAGVYPYYGATGIQDYVDNYIFDGRYVLVGEDGAKWGANERSAYIIEGKSWVNNHAHVLSFTSDMCDSFVAYYLNYKDLDSFISGAIVRKLTQKSLISIPLPIPSLEEQQAIVRELDGINRLIDLQEEQLREYDRLAQSLFYTTFGDPATNPKGWEVKKLGEVAEPTTGITYSPDDVVDDGIIVLRSSNIQDNQLDFDDIVRVRKTVAEKYYVKAGDILMCSRNGSFRLVGKTALVDNLNEKMTWGAFMTIIRSDYNPYLLQYFRTPAFREQLTTAKTTTVNQITIGMLKKIQLPIPPANLQQTFAAQIETIEQQKELIRASIAETEALLAARMQYYFD